MSKFYVSVLVTRDPVPTHRLEAREGCPMPDTYLKGRPVYFGELSFCGVDTYFQSASYADTDEELDDDELGELTEQEGDYICEQVMERCGYWPD